LISFLVSALKIIILLGFLVLIHEGGHFLVAKLFKIKVNEFAIGFGPTIFTKEKGETKYALRLIPLGGFVSMEGEEERSEKEGSFSMASVPKRIAIVAAGGLVNIIFGILLYYIISSISLNSMYYGVIDTKDFMMSILESLKLLFTGNVFAEQMVGIVGISDIVVNTTGIMQYLYIMALISVSLGTTNLLPFPPLDGGKIVIYLIEFVRRKPLKEETELKIQTWGFAILIALAIYVTYNDIMRIF
jgi:membrane-associated protease RseP (regulator of RpoE activity)